MKMEKGNIFIEQSVGGIDIMWEVRTEEINLTPSKANFIEFGTEARAYDNMQSEG